MVALEFFLYSLDEACCNRMVVSYKTKKQHGGHTQLLCHTRVGGRRRQGKKLKSYPTRLGTIVRNIISSRAHYTATGVTAAGLLMHILGPYK